MTLRSTYHFILLWLVSLLLNSCIEPYDFETEEFENLLVVQATLTDELKHQEVRISRTFRLEEELPELESGAQVTVTGNNLDQPYIFREASPGIYLSEQPFAVAAGNNYVLEIQTADGGSYSSEPVSLIAGNSIDKVYGQRTEYQGEDGIAILVNSKNPETASEFYRYEYEETYKIVSPYVVRNNLIPEGGQDFSIVPNTRNETICYNSRASNAIILSNTSTLSENTSGSFLVHFIEAGNPVIGQRYSILIKQYSLTPEAYSYYSTLEKISSSESVLSETQPGFVFGNLYSLENESEKVIGFFGVSSVSSKRIFFNYEDFFTPDGSPPQFPEDCSIYRPGIDFLTPIELIRSGDSRFVGFSSGTSTSELGEGPIRLISNECVDCTVYGTTEVPEFWVD